MHVNVYEVTREYGGAEEGGWWYNNYACIKSFPFSDKKSAEKHKKELIKSGEYTNVGNIYSVLGGVAFEILIEETEAESETRERPHYE